MVTSTYTKVNIWAYLSRVGVTGIITLIIITLFIGQFISSQFGKYIGWVDFKAGPGLAYILYLMGALAGVYAIGWYNPAMGAPEGLGKRMLIGGIIAVICFLVGIGLKTYIPDLFAIMPMKVDMALQPFSVVGLP